MAREKTLYSSDQNWKVELEAWKLNLYVYQSIGTEATVYHKEKTTDTWGNTKTDWVKKPCSSITITNKYSGSDPKISITRDKTCTNVSYCEQHEWAVGIIKITGDGLGVPGATLIVDKVEGHVSVRIGNEVLTGDVSASSIVDVPTPW